MRTRLATLGVCIAMGIATCGTFQYDTRAQSEDNQGRRDESQMEAAIERGKYIAHHVAMCIYCHTPKNAEGELDRQQLLQGAPMPVASPFPRQQWAFQAPKIAGLPGGWNEQDLMKFLQTGETPTGHHPQPPMPPFRLTEEDAQSIVAYLKSLQ
jgi:mono/diheme cytochrome c family protein